MNISTYLKSTKGTKSVLYFRFYYKKTPFKISSTISVNVANWSIKKQHLKTSDENYYKINNRLAELKGLISDYFDDNDVELDDVKNVCANLINNIPTKPFIAVIEQSGDGAYSRYKKLDDFNSENGKNTSELSIENIIQKYIVDNKLVISDNRLRHYKTVINKLKECKLNKILIDEFSVEHLTKFRNYLLNKGLLNNTINHKIKLLKAPIRNFDPQHPALLFKNIKLTQLQHALLNEEELDALRKFTDLSESLGRVKDIFIFSCCTGQRIGDIFSLNKVDIEDKHWLLRQSKTKKVVNIPLNTEALRILEKYDYIIPKMTQQNYNKRLKLLLSKANINRHIVLKRESGNKKMDITCSIDNRISSHMGRRIFITHSLNRGVPINVVATITGQTIQTLQKYVNTQQDAIDKFYL
jgi:integrase